MLPFSINVSVHGTDGHYPSAHGISIKYAYFFLSPVCLETIYRTHARSRIFSDKMLKCVFILYHRFLLMLQLHITKRKKNSEEKTAQKLENEKMHLLLDVFCVAYTIALSTFTSSFPNIICTELTCSHWKCCYSCVGV